MNSRIRISNIAWKKSLQVLRENFGWTMEKYLDVIECDMSIKNPSSGFWTFGSNGPLLVTSTTFMWNWRIAMEKWMTTADQARPLFWEKAWQSLWDGLAQKDKAWGETVRSSTKKIKKPQSSNRTATDTAKRFALRSPHPNSLLQSILKSSKAFLGKMLSKARN